MDIFCEECDEECGEDHTLCECGQLVCMPCVRGGDKHGEGVCWDEDETKD